MASEDLRGAFEGSSIPFVGEDRERDQSGRRVTVDEAARHLGLTVDAIRKRVQREQIPFEKDGAGRVRIILDESETLQDGSPDTTGRITAEDYRGELVEELRDRVRYLEKLLDEEREARTEERRRQDTVIAQLSASNAEQARTIRELEAPQEASGAAETDEEAPEGAEPQSATGATAEATERRAAQPVRRLPLWQWVLGGALSLLAFPAAELLAIVIPSLPNWTSTAFVLIPGVFGYWVGLRLRKLSFWRHLAPMGGLLLAGVFVGSWLLWKYVVWITGWLFGFGTAGLSVGPSLARNPSLFGILLVISPAALYSFAALLGNAMQRRKREQLSEAGPSESRWSPRQQAFVGLAGTVISAVIGLIGTMLTVMSSGNGG